MKDESDGDSNCNWYDRYNYQRTDTRTGGYRNKRTSGDIQITPWLRSARILSPGHLRRLDVTQTPAEDHQLMLEWKLSKSKFDHTNKWYIHNPVPVLENDTHKLLWDFNIQTDHLIPARSPYLIMINKKKRICKLWTLLSGGPQNKSEECERRISTSTLLENWKSCGTWK